MKTYGDIDNLSIEKLLSRAPRPLFHTRITLSYNIMSPMLVTMDGTLISRYAAAFIMLISSPAAMHNTSRPKAPHSSQSTSGITRIGHKTTIIPIEKSHRLFNILHVIASAMKAPSVALRKID
jgi:hypothetical protein